MPTQGCISHFGLPGWLSGKESTCQCRRHGFNPWVRKIPWRRKWRTLVCLPGKSHEQRSLVGYLHGLSKELDTTEHTDNWQHEGNADGPVRDRQEESASEVPGTSILVY